MIKTAIVSALGVVLALGAASPLQAKSSPIEDWVSTVNQKIDVALASRLQPSEGQATVTFRRASDGRATDIEARASDYGVQQAALLTAHMLHDLPPLPAGVAPDQRITMHILIRSDGDFDSFQRERYQLLASAKVINQQMANRVTNNQLASLNVAH